MNEAPKDEPWEWHIKETYKGLITISIEALKALALVNGGAAVAILAYLGNVANVTAHPRLNSVPDMTNALLCFAVGLFTTVCAFIFSYLAQLRLFHEERCRHRGKHFADLPWILLVIAILLVFTAAAAFGVGCWSSASAMKGYL